MGQAGRRRPERARPEAECWVLLTHPQPCKYRQGPGRGPRAELRLPETPPSGVREQPSGRDPWSGGVFLLGPAAAGACRKRPRQPTLVPHARPQAAPLANARCRSHRSGVSHGAPQRSGIEAGAVPANAACATQEKTAHHRGAPPFTINACFWAFSTPKWGGVGVLRALAGGRGPSRMLRLGSCHGLRVTRPSRRRPRDPAWR